MTQPLDPAGDPDRFDPTRDAEPAAALDPGLDPDRYDPAADTLPGLLGVGPQEDERDTWTWLVGLLGVLAFLGLVALVMSRLTPA